MEEDEDIYVPNGDGKGHTEVPSGDGERRRMQAVDERRHAKITTFK